MNKLENSFPNLPKRIHGLEELAENLWWSWNPTARMLFKTLDRQAWKASGHNPDKMLKELPSAFFDKAVMDPNFLRNYDQVMSRFKKYMMFKGCPLISHRPDQEVTKIAYFSAEYGLHRSLPFYAGGLGFLAGDHLKECSDMNVPLVAVGFMYPEGYLLQRIRQDGWQENITEMLQRDAAAINKVYNADGAQLVVAVPLIEPPIHVAVWCVDVGKVPLYLMDTDIKQNEPWNREISARLYTGDLEQRLRQEIVLGIGGAEVLETMGFKRFVLHLNEGHAAFALLEQIRDRINQGMDFDKALQYVQNSSVFTTHTPVPAGHDVFPFDLIEKFLCQYWKALGLDRDAFFKLGLHPERPEAGFNMTALALRLSKYRNAVSKKHGEVSRQMWQSLWGESVEKSNTIEHITNGVHVPTWIEPKMQLLLNKYLEPGWMVDHDDRLIWESIDKIPDEELWKTHYWLKIKLIDAIRERSRLRWAVDRANPSVVLAGGALLDPSVFTIGFARRFATYKRADLILYDIERLKTLLNDRWRPIQIIFAGKAHPADDPGKQILQRIFNASCNPEMGGRMVFVEDYGEQLAQYLLHGVDVWLNTPLPPMEASGTSGMKAALNGVPHLSILDGWWLEGYNQKNGWAITHQVQNGNQDQADADEVYRILEEQIIPLYYAVSEDGTPHDWVKIMKAAIKSAAVKFSARRMVKEYVKKFYVKALKNL